MVYKNLERDIHVVVNVNRQQAPSSGLMSLAQATHSTPGLRAPPAGHTSHSNTFLCLPAAANIFKNKELCAALCVLKRCTAFRPTHQLQPNVFGNRKQIRAQRTQTY